MRSPDSGQGDPQRDMGHDLELRRHVEEIFTLAESLIPTIQALREMREKQGMGINPLTSEPLDPSPIAPDQIGYDQSGNLHIKIGGGRDVMINGFDDLNEQSGRAEGNYNLVISSQKKIDNFTFQGHPELSPSPGIVKPKPEPEINLVGKQDITYTIEGLKEVMNGLQRIDGRIKQFFPKEAAA